MIPIKSIFLGSLLFAFSANCLFAVAPILNIKATHPQDVSLEAGLILGPDFGSDWSSSSHGLALSIEPGKSGHKAHVGYGYFEAAPGMIRSLRVTGTYYWDAGHVSSSAPSDDYYGFQVTGGLWFVVCSAGVLWNTQSSDSVVTFGVGVGF
ncbi:MAG: hypothetical protein LAT55_10470 [Opitutales bacterium]|nr:hypothetical protein [Opitutales bacterium]